MASESAEATPKADREDSGEAMVPSSKKSKTTPGEGDAAPGQPEPNTNGSAKTAKDAPDETDD